MKHCRASLRCPKNLLMYEKQAVREYTFSIKPSFTTILLTYLILQFFLTKVNATKGASFNFCLPRYWNKTMFNFYSRSKTKHH